MVREKEEKEGPADEFGLRKFKALLTPFPGIWHKYKSSLVTRIELQSGTGYFLPVTPLSCTAYSRR